MYPRPLPPPRKARRVRRSHLLWSSVIVLLALGYGGLVLTRPFASLQPNSKRSDLVITTPAGNLPWPAYGQGAIGLSNGTSIASHGEQTPIPIASAAKVITALVVLQKHPLAADADGPTITLTDNDVALYNNYVAVHGSVMPVASGQRLTLHQMLQALLLPSANNIADSLAIWSYGSIDAYLTAANTYTKQHQLTDTHLGGDASGFLPDNASTARDLVRIGALGLAQPALKEIFNQPTAVIPGVGTVRNVNPLLGNGGVIGIKTGNNDQDGGVFIGAATTTVNDKTVTIISALAGAPNLSTVLRDSASLLAATKASFASTTIVHKDDVLGTYSQPDGSKLQAIAAQDLNVVVLRGDSVKAHIALESLPADAKAGKTVGSVRVAANDSTTTQSVPIILKQTPTKPSLRYRLLHP